MNLISDSELVEKVKNGDQTAFNIIVGKYQTRIERCVFRIVKDSEATKDLTQETFLNAYKSIDKFRGDSKLYTWLYSIARNASMSYLKAKNKRGPHITFDPNDDDCNEKSYTPKVYKDLLTPESHMICDEMVKTINTTMDGINKDMRETFLLRCEGELSYENIAKELNIPIGTAKSRVSKVREQINNDLGIEYDRRRNKNSKKK